MLIGSQSTGQGHDTAYAQIIADHLGLPPERVRMIQGDTDLIATGTGTGGSSSIPCGGASVAGAAQEAREQAQGARRRCARSERRRSRDRRRRGAGRRHRPRDLVRRSRPAARTRVAGQARRPTTPSRRRRATYPNGTHLAEVEIDPETGATRIVNYVVVDDFGVTLNPLLLAGQVHGGTVQGIGQALMEQTVYDPDSGQLVTASLMDYALPRAGRHAPSFVFETRNVPCPTNPLGVKGAGEAGAIGSCPAVMNAVVDALWRALPHPPRRHAGDARARLGRDRRGHGGCIRFEFQGCCNDRLHGIVNRRASLPPVRFGGISN